MSPELSERIRENPKFHALIRKRNRFSMAMSLLVVLVYFGYILLLAFDKALLAAPVSAGGVTPIGIPLGLGVILLIIVLTWIYVGRANAEFDAKTEAIIKESQR